MTAIQAQPWVESFSAREFEVLELVSNGLSNREIAQKLHLSVETVKWYNKQMYMKLGVKNRIQAVNRAAELNLLDSNLSLGENLAILGNLPAGLTSYVGREKEIGEIKALLKEHRLVVLTGAGGSGKTRLALKVGEYLQSAYKDGVWLVELANLCEPSLVLGAIAQVLNITESANEPLAEVLMRYLGRKDLLLLIDNLEHLLDCAPMIGDLLAAAPGLSVLGTSRERLHIYGEQEYPVHPLDLPVSVAGRPREELEKVESVALFIKRAQAVQPDLSLNDKALGDLARICVRLDGLPLAIELCAPMVKVFPLDVIAERIEDSLDVIPSGPRDLPLRQQTLRNTIQWSYDLLTVNEKNLFVRMSVFNGGATRKAVEAVCGDGISGDVGNVLSTLVNKNMVLAREQGDGEIHFSLLETLRQFGNDKLLASGKFSELANRHARYFMELAKTASVKLRGPDQILWTHRMITMRENLRSALGWVMNNGETNTALWFVSNLFEFWLRRAEFMEARRWLEQVLQLPDAQKFPDIYVQALNELSWIHWLQGRAWDARTMAEQALPLARSQSNKLNTVIALLNLGLMLVIRNDDFDRGRTYIGEAEFICHELHDEWELARSFMALAVVRSHEKKYSETRSYYSKAYNLYKKLGDINFQCVVKRLIGDFEVRQNNLEAGVDAYRESLKTAQVVKNDLQIAYNIWGLWNAANVERNFARAVRLYLGGKRILEDIGVWSSGDDLRLKKELESARTELGEIAFQSAWETGQNMGLEELIEFALGEGRIE